MNHHLYKLSITLILCLAGFATIARGNTTNSINFGEIKPGRITGPAQMNYYTFAASSNDVIDVTLLRTNGSAEPYFYLYGADGALLAASSISGGYVAVVNGVRLTKTGTNTLVVIANDLVTSYDYFLSLTKVAGGVNLRESGDGPEAILPGQITSGHTSPADMDTYTFTGTSNDVIFATLLRTNGVATPFYSLYDPEGTVVLSSTISGGYVAVGSLRLTRSGTYTLLVIANDWANSYDYLLSLTKVAGGVNLREPGDGAEAMLPGQITNGHISPADMDTYTFTGTSNDVIFATLLRTNGVGEPFYYLYDPEGTVVLSSTISGGYVAVGSLRLTRSGTYTLLVIANDWANSYDYLLSLTKVAGGVNQREVGDGAEAMLPGQITNGHISPVDMDTYTFTGASNDVIFATLLRTNGLGTPFYYLYDPEGTVVLSSTISGGYVAVGSLRLTQSGTYTLMAIANDWANTFDYLLSLTKVAGGLNQREAGDGAEAILPGQITNGHITPADMDTYTFTGTSNDVIFATLLRTNGVGVPFYYLYDPEGTVVLSSTISGGYVAVGSLRLTQSGTYTLMVIANDWANSFDYLLSLTKVAGGVNQREAGDGAEVILPGQITSGHISPADMDTYTFIGASNDVIYATFLRTNGTGTPYFYLYDPEGTVVLGSTISGGYVAVGSLRLTKSGTYTLLAIENSWADTCDYLLSLTKVAGGLNQREASDGPEALLPGRVTSGHISPSDMDTYTFTGASNDVIIATLLRTNGTGVPYFYLYGPDGTLVSGSSISGGYVASVNGLRLSRTGTYTLLAIENSLAGSFDYTVCMIRNPGPNFSDSGDGAYTIEPYETRSAQITPGDLDAFAFHAIAGDTLSVTLQKTSGPGLNPILQLHAPDGTILASASSASSAHIRVPCVAQTGTYLIVVFDDGYNEAFGYDVSLAQSPIVPPSSGTNQYLAIFECTNHIIVRWETNAVGFALESTLTMPPTNWLPVNRIPQIIGDHYYVDDGLASNSSKYYRLKCTNCVTVGLAP